ncbi:phosphoribosyltransferase [Saccharothrix australiensis]|uniref:Phosphoribosyltransferase domain-containing protein n=1 Tax=Saccharothrix australiensis TaxID=2072 RepID=A0A495VX98_9PSEU|nr:phosphoribosyltransferase family protein [Saccharothrix australiensis]RKT53824.1 hypothetical protein C8E97_2406 [Saccharothrix australiensis]
MTRTDPPTAMWARAGAYVFEWADVGRALTRIEDGVRASGFRPTVVHAVARGGLVAGAHLANVLDVPRLSLTRVRRTTSDERYAAKREPTCEPFGALDLVEGDRVLVVDDIVGTGATAEVVRDQVLAAGVAELRFAVLVRNHLAEFAVDDCGFVADDWVVFPWEDGFRDRPAGWRAVPW